MEELKAGTLGGVIRVRVKTGAGENRIHGFNGQGELIVSIKSVPERGKANAELVNFLRKQTRKKAVIVSGFYSSKKTIRLSE